MISFRRAPNTHGGRRLRAVVPNTPLLVPTLTAQRSTRWPRQARLMAPTRANIHYRLPNHVDSATVTKPVQLRTYKRKRSTAAPTPPRRSPRFPQPQELHRPQPAQSRGIQMSPTPSTAMSPLTIARHQRRFRRFHSSKLDVAHEVVQ